ncbi:hypothetical protein M8C13_11475 [Crossiella sp. SN42]|uniref:hypothetical protein n=1 Tax=Crossiella sp. SN42 TaxID=2944808 RepID=UPI00207C2DFE|nr:hypothetical protein [Crossiella sp. SN42]MCO1576372.1 hypothetical protein [Crossiella sp. SN42]
MCTAAIGIAAVITTVVAPGAALAEGSAPRPVEQAQIVSTGHLPGVPVIELVEGEAPKVSGGDRSVTATRLPFNYNFNFARTLDSRNFWPSGHGKACVALRMTSTTNPDDWGKTLTVQMWDADGWDTQVGSDIGYLMDGNYRGYCWTALRLDHEHYFKLVKSFGPSTIKGDGSATEN